MPNADHKIARSKNSPIEIAKKRNEDNLKIAKAKIAQAKIGKLKLSFHPRHELTPSVHGTLLFSFLLLIGLCMDLLSNYCFNRNVTNQTLLRT